MTDAPDYAAFISYAHVDDRWARWLHHRLESYRLPKGAAPDGRRRIGRVFLDRSELASSGSLSTAIQSALDRAGALVVICSPASAASRWVNEEVRRFRAQGRGDRIFCLIVAGDPAGVTASSPFPPALLEPMPGEEVVEPLAADVRPGKDGRGDALLKLIAGIERLPFDALRRREQGRQQKRLAAIAIAASVLLVIMTALAIGQVLARREAERQRDTADNTAGFMLNIFNHALPEYAAGKDVTVRQMLAMSADETLRSPELARAPDVRATLLTQLAEVEMKIGDYHASDALLRAARLDSDPDAERIMWQAAISAENALRLGDAPRADKLIAEVDDVTPASSQEATDRRVRLLTLSGEVAAADRDWTRALRRLDEARRLALSGASPNRAAAATAIYISGKASLEAGDLPAAEKALRYTIAERIALGQPDHPDVLGASNSLAALAAKRGDTVTAEREFRRVIALQTRVLGAAHGDTATTRGNLGRVLVEQRRFADAARELLAARPLLVASAGPQLDTLANVDDSLGLAQANLGDIAAARASFVRGLGIARANAMPKEVELLADRGEMECGAGDAVLGLQLVAASRAALARFALAEPWRRARIDQVEAACLIAAGRRDAAAPLVRESLDAVVARWGTRSLFGAAAIARARRLGVAPAA